ETLQNVLARTPPPAAADAFRRELRRIVGEHIRAEYVKADSNWESFKEDLQGEFADPQDPWVSLARAELAAEAGTPATELIDVEKAREKSLARYVRALQLGESAPEKAAEELTAALASSSPLLR